MTNKTQSENGDQMNKSCEKVSIEENMTGEEVINNGTGENSPNNNNDENDSNCEIFKINIEMLQPKSLMVVPVSIVESGTCEALLDSGATNTLIKESELKNINNIKIETDRSKTIIGIAGKTIETLGSVTMMIDLFGIKMKGEMEVVRDNDIMYSVIIGVNFLVDHKFSIDLSRRKISKMFSDGSIRNNYLDNNNKVVTVVSENVPVRASKTITMKANTTVSVPVIVDIPVLNSEHNLNCLYFNQK